MPKVAVITWLDVYQIFMFAVIFFCVVEYMMVHFAARSDSDLEKDQVSFALKLDKWSRTVLPIGTITGCLIMCGVAAVHHRWYV